MKVAIISDIHSNLNALRTVWKHILCQKCERIYCLGDIVGYGPKPLECWKAIKEISVGIVKGNHEDCVCTPSKEENINLYAIEGVRFSRSHLPDEVINKIRLLPTKLTIEDLDLTICHGSFSEPSAWEYIDSPNLARKELKVIPTRLCAIGHTHNPFLFSSQGLVDLIPDNMELDLNKKYIINVGSVGQPRDSDCRASYCTLDFTFEETKITKIVFNLHRVFYNIAQTDKEIAEAKISTFLAERLYRGE